MPQPARYKQIVDRIAEDIASGRLKPGTRLPTHRELAAREGLGIVTATRVYAELDAMGLVSGETGRGTFVKEAGLPNGLGIDQVAIASDIVDLSFNYPALAGQTEMLRTALRQLASAGNLEALLRYQPHAGRLHERACVARHLERRGLSIDAEQVLLVDGAQHGLATTVMGLLKPGDVVAVDALTYTGFKLLAQSQRLELAPLAASGAGPDLDALEALCKRRRVRAIYTMPTLHNPLGWVMTASRRKQLVSIARKHGLFIIEDAAYAFLADDTPPPLAALAPDITVYVSGFSKSVATGLRVGYVVAPREWVAKIERAIRVTTWNTPGVMTALACGWLEDGTVERLEAEKRADATMRQTVAARALSRLKRLAHPASYFIWLPMPEEVRADRIAKALMQERISVSTAEPFCTTAHVPHALRLALGSVDVETLRLALERVQEVVSFHIDA
ncbi:PLP-dependent aminotransferase family protein [Caballeronia sp. LZ034LL]|uniref:aminotransferase-like domain-containing protein n=1 Tax=Caballeronia sp. LZ034LL TaxID=3038567 RepID=UPI00285B4803|nr:PLP-dependent aminotransferase family protein [Caballeronia sp. LZ034LL]MDR5837796.1 PLP-dependent aminotransferase family protein [Caballeronia sp. LZ034LL]